MTHYLAGTQRALAAELRDDPGADLPTTVTEVVAVAEQTDGVRLRELLAVIEPDTDAVGTTLAQILRDAADE